LARQVGFEPTSYSFGDRHFTVKLLRYKLAEGVRLELTHIFMPSVFKTAAARPTRLTLPIIGGYPWSRTKIVYPVGVDLQSTDAHTIASRYPENETQHDGSARD
jgi:hypothetical protein